MTMIIRISDPTRCHPIEDLELNLDSTDDYARFEELFPDLLLVVCHLYEGEKLEFECIRRIDEGMF